MLFSLIFLSLAASDVQEARALYGRALYDDALRALGPSCDASDDPHGCDEVRAFIYMALGREADAAAAFDRMLARAPTGALSTQVAPKIQSLYRQRRQAIAALLTTRLAPVAAAGDEVPVPVKLEPGDGIALRTVTLLIRPETDEAVRRVPMAREGGAWVGMVVLEEPDEARYAVELELTAGSVVRLGGTEPSLPLETVALEGSESDQWSSGPAIDSDEHAGFPTWAWWTLGGVAVVGAVVAGVLVASGSGEGDLTVGVRFEGDSP